MRHGRKQGRRLVSTAAGLAVIWIVSTATTSANVDIADRPLFLPGAVPPLNMLVMSRDHTLYYEAYNDASDLNGDGVVDVGYKPEINYFGYFDSFKCYDYSSGRFVPKSTTPDKRCNGLWSGDFLNYLTTSRMDAMRKVLYGGKRWQDTATETVLERSFIPQDAHSWGKEYHGPSHDGYDISDYTPLSIPSSGRRHLFVNTTPLGENRPLLRILTNETVRIWNWVSIERPVAGNQVVVGINSNGREIRDTRSPTDYTVRVSVCVAGLEEPNCKVYPNGNSKPIGLLQEFGEDDKMLFGLLSGSYANNLRGGVLRKNIGSMKDEIDPDTGQFIETTPVGIIGTLDRFRIAQFTGGSHTYFPGPPADWSRNLNSAWITTRPIDNGEMQDWGNPVAEMMYEALRYYAGLGAPTNAFSISASGNTDASLGLPVASWQEPFEAFPVCSAAVKTVVSGIYPSYDTEFVPGSAFSSFTGDSLGGLNASALGDLIWAQEFGGPGQHFIGESGADRDGAPTVKTVTPAGG